MRRARSAPPWLVLGALVAVSTGLRYWAASRIPIPWIAPDELIYAELGRSLWTTGRLDVLGESTRFFSLVTPALAGGPLALSDLGLGYALVKAIQSFVMSLAAVPVYLWGRTVTASGWALAAAALTLAIPGLAYSGLIVTEVAVYPLAVLAAWAMARAIARPTGRAQLLALGALLLVAATRLQSAVLVPAFVTAAIAFALWQRRPRSLLRLWPTTVGIAIAGSAWAAWQLRNGGPATKLLGAYQAAGEVDYDAGAAVRFVVYHAADVVLFTGVLPVLALVCLLARGARDEPLRAFLAVTVSIVLWQVVAVGVFASRHVGHLAERNLFAVAPLFFLAFAVWAGRGAPRPRVATAVAGTAALVLALLLPVERFVSLASVPDTFTLIPLWRLEVRAPSVDLDLVLAAGTAVAVCTFALVSRRLVPWLAVALGVMLAAASVSAARVVAAQATLAQPGAVGPDPSWVDRSVRSHAAYLYSGDVYWTSVWETVFWNRSVRRVYDLLDAEVPGGLPQESIGPLEDGRLVDKTGVEVAARYVVASDSLRFAGRRIADGRNGIRLWRVAAPVRLTQWKRDVRFDSTVERRARLIAYACRGGRLELRLWAPGPRRVELLQDGRPVRSVRLVAGETFDATLAASARRPLGKQTCDFDVLTDGRVYVRRLTFRRSPS